MQTVIPEQDTGDCSSSTAALVNGAADASPPSGLRSAIAGHTPDYKREDDFRGSTDLLLRSIDAFLDLTDEQAFVPHNLSKGSHAYRLLVAARVRLEASIRSEAETAVKLVNALALAEQQP